MKHLLIFVAEDGNVVRLSFTLNRKLDGQYYGTWNEDTSDIHLSTEAWDFFLQHKKDARRLKPMMDKLHKYSRTLLH